jgi:hypothetical protein
MLHAGLDLRRDSLRQIAADLNADGTANRRGRRAVVALDGARRPPAQGH